MQSIFKISPLVFHNFPSYSRKFTIIIQMSCIMLSGHLSKVLGDTPSFNEQDAPKTQEDLLAIQDALMTAYPKVKEATVSISIGEGFGSGVIVSEDGLILTAAHVTAAVDKELTVILNDGTELEAVSMGLLSESDAAMMRITEEGKYPYVEINRDDDYRKSHWTFALGHSGGFDKDRGPVLRLGRIIRDTDTTLHSDCKVIGGDSGGPLFDLDGKLIAIHSRVSKRLEENMHVPMREYLKHWEELSTNQFIGDGPFAKRPVKGSGFLGFASSDTDKGLKIDKLLSEGVAETSGFLVGDILLKMDDVEIANKAALKEFMAEKAEGDKVRVTLLRADEEVVIELKLGKR